MLEAIALPDTSRRRLVRSSSGIEPTEARILGSAVALFGAKGYASTSIRDICTAANVCRPTLYYFYGSKEGLLHAVLKQTTEQVNRLIATALSGDDSFQVRCTRLACSLFRYGVEHPDYCRFALFVSRSNSGAVQADGIARIRSEAIQLVADAAAGRFPSCEGRDPRLFALIFTGAMTHALESFFITGSPLLTPNCAEDIVAALFRGWA